MQLNRKNIVLRKSTKIGTIFTPKRLKFQKRIELLFVVCHKVTVLCKNVLMNLQFYPSKRLNLTSNFLKHSFMQKVPKTGKIFNS